MPIYPREEQITNDDVDGLIRSMLNYYLLVQCGIIHDPDLTPRFLDAVKEIAKKGTSIFEIEY